MSKGEAYKGPTIVDPAAFQINQANGKSIAQEYRNQGLPLRPGLRVNHYGNHAMIENVRRLFQNDQLFFTEGCPNAIYEHMSYRYKENKEGEAPYNEPFEKKDDHTVDALKLLVAENPQYQGRSQGEVADSPMGDDV